MHVHNAALSYSNSQSLYLSLSPIGQTGSVSNGNTGNDTASAASQSSDQVSLSAAGQLASAQAQGQQGVDLNPALSMLKKVLHQALGLDVGLVDVQALETQQSDSESASAFSIQGNDGNGSGQSAQGVSYEEKHSAELALSGTLVTKDGQKLNFSLDLSVESDISLQEAQLDQRPATQVDASPLAGADNQAKSGGDQTVATAASQPAQFNLGNDAGALSGASVQGVLSKMLQEMAGGAGSSADSGKAAGAGKNNFGQLVLNLLAHFKLWTDQPDAPLADQTLKATAQPASAQQADHAPSGQGDQTGYQQQAAPAPRIDTSA